MNRASVEVTGVHFRTPQMSVPGPLTWDPDRPALQSGWRIQRLFGQAAAIRQAGRRRTLRVLRPPVICFHTQAQRRLRVYRLRDGRSPHVADGGHDQCGLFQSRGQTAVRPGLRSSAAFRASGQARVQAIPRRKRQSSPALPSIVAAPQSGGHCPTANGVASCRHGVAAGARAPIGSCGSAVRERRCCGQARRFPRAYSHSPCSA